MQTRGTAYFEGRLDSLKSPPLHCQLELTYRCNYNCLHCYCKGRENAGRELPWTEIAGIFSQMEKANCLWLTLTGGECLLRPDFAEIYMSAKRRGFIVSVMTNGSLIDGRILRLFAKSPPFSVEMTINGARADTFNRVTGTAGLFRRVRQNAARLAREGVPVIVKANLLRENAGELAGMKKWASGLPGRRGPGRYNFRVDPFIHPRLDGGMQPCRHRLGARDIAKAFSRDAELLSEFRCGLRSPAAPLERGRNFLYQCTSWKDQFFINPFGVMSFCQLTDEYSADLRLVPLEKGLAGLRRLARAKFKTGSECISCPLRPLCGTCPAKAALETGNGEAPVPYYCETAAEIAKMSLNERKKLRGVPKQGA